MDILVKNFHILILAYALFGAFEYFETQDVKLKEAESFKESSEVKLQKAKLDLRKVEQYRKDLEASEKRVQEVVAKLEELTRQLPPNINDTEISTILERYTSKLKMLDLNFAPGKEESRSFYFAKDYFVDVRGTYLQFLILYEKLENLAKNGRILNVKYLKMKKSETGDKRSRFQILDLTTTFEAYKSNSQFDMRDFN